MAHTINALCDGCSACAGQCPTEAIHGLFKERYTIDERLCIDCGVCGWICPIDAVLDAKGAVVPHLPRDQRPRPLVDPEGCNGCKLCVDICSVDALKIVGPQYRGVAVLAEPLACVACGDCVPICIKGAITMGPLDLRTYDAGEQSTRLREFLEECG